MRNDARPIGEEFRDIAEHDHQERTEKPVPPERGREGNKPFVTERQTEGEEMLPDASER